MRGAGWLRASSAGLAVLAGLATVAGVAGFTLFVTLVSPPRPAPLATPGRLVAGDMVLEVRSTAWVDGAGPGARCLEVQAVVTNVSRGDVSLDARDFTVRGEGDLMLPLDRRAVFAAGSLRPGQARSLDLLFDVPDEATRLDLAWDHGGQIHFVQVGARPAGP